jgi:hypothetical protein
MLDMYPHPEGLEESDSQMLLTDSRGLDDTQTEESQTV